MLTGPSSAVRGIMRIRSCGESDATFGEKYLGIIYHPKQYPIHTYHSIMDCETKRRDIVSRALWVHTTIIFTIGFGLGYLLGR